MKVDRVAFRETFVQRAAARPVAAGPVDQVSVGPAVAPRLRPLDQAVLALAAAGPAGVAVVAQEAARALVTRSQEEALAASTREAYASYAAPPDERVQRCWQRIQEVAGPSEFPPPQVVTLGLVFAEANSLDMYVGASALAGELASDDVLTFALAHEEGHRRHRDSAGSTGLEALVEVTGDSPPEVSRLGFLALREGRHENERQADAFAADVVGRLGCDPKPLEAFLRACEEDMQHPAGSARAEAVLARMAQSS